MTPESVPVGDERTSDQPLTHPHQDLLGVASHAAVLARVVSTTPTPFTVGVYGEWGAGKTTFVRFVEHYLAGQTAAPAEPTLFVHFEGWQHHTADELWRALMLQLTRAVYEHTQGTEAVAPPSAVEEPGTTQLRRVLGRYAVGGEPPAEQPRDRYWKFVERLDSTLYGGISRRSPEASRLNQDEAVLAAVRASVAALSAASPLVAGVRQLLRLDTAVDPAALFQRERNEATRERIESRREFQDALAHLLDMIPAGERVCVFLDDLDRCMPDVVLDLLEAIKIFLHVEKMVFVVAADEELIGKGLRLRYRELAEGSGGAQEGEFLARKGQEYFEKIIQLRINLPECTPEHAHRLIAAQYPEWMPATDIILAAVGSNPRRLKQYCSWLAFRRGVDLAEREKKKEDEPGRQQDPQRRRRKKRNEGREPLRFEVTDEERAARAALFDKLIVLASRDRECVELLHGLARDEDFAVFARRLEARLAERPGTGGAATDAPGDATTAGRWARLYRRIRGSAPLLAQFRAGPALSACARRDVETLAAMADVRPHPELMLTAGDGPFMRALRHVSQPGSSAPERMFQEGLAKLLSLRVSHPALFGPLLPLAEGDWAAGARALEAALQTDDHEGLPEPWKAVFGRVRTLAVGTAASTDPAALLLASPRLSEILPEEVRALGSIDMVPDPGPPPPSAASSEDEQRRRQARAVYDALPPTLRANVLARLELRLWAAAHCLELRAFARLNGLERQWPELARLLRTDRATLRALEVEAARPGSIAPEYRSVSDRYAHDERLRRFLVLKPLVSDIAPAEVREYFSVSQSIAPAGEAVAVPPQAAASPPPAGRPRFDYVDVVVKLVERNSARPPAPPADLGRPGRPATFDVVLEGPGTPVKGTAVVPWTQLIETMPSLYREALDGPMPQGPGMPDLSPRTPNPESVLRAQGSLMWRWVFAERVGRRMQELRAEDRAFRLLLEFPSSLAALPWESLYLEQERSFLGLTQRYSLVRYMPPSAFPIAAAITAPLRILVVLVNPPGKAELDLEGELAAIEEAIRPGLQDGRVQLHVLEDEEAEAGELMRVLRTFRPQVFHFAGHGIFHQGEGALILHGLPGSGKIKASEMATLLRDAGISLAFLNACNTGSPADNDAIASVAGSLVTAGVPAVIATLHDITDRAGLLFTREWYRAFAEGYPLEAAIIEARKRLSVERWEWWAFSLFSSTRDLDELVFPQGSFRKP